MSDNQQNGAQSTPNQTIIIQQQDKKSNGLGVAGFVLALLGLIFCWVPVLGWILWFLGLLLSFIAVFKAPRGLAIAGVIVSCISLIIILFVVAGVAALAGLAL